MLLTKRRRQFLRKLVDLYRRTNLPIHYATLANALGVSKWTAYDMMKAMEKMGLLIRSYAANGGDSGRTQVLFVPTEQAKEMVEAESADTACREEEWQAIKTAVLGSLRAFRNGGRAEALGRMTAEMRSVKRKLEYCAYGVGLLVAHLRKAGGTTEEFVRNVVRKAPTGEMRMTMLAGAVLGTLAQSMSEAGSEIAEMIGTYLKSVAGLTDREKAMMSDLLLEALV
ncbi:DNA-binding protein [Cohnella thermotolerans]|uniref:DNA-binding protein n=1 Tax=Cohnella thermotolerans TaxID=329858 RepID=UPI000428B15D|nr:DNA-binding protein [Cohnella thermotolerans]